MLNSIRAEMIVVGRRPATWTLLAIWLALSTIFGYGYNYIAYLGDATDPQNPLFKMLPHYLVANRILGFPFFGGVIALIFGVLVFGSEYGWGTPKTLFTLGPSRLHVLGAKAIALVLVLFGFVVASFGIGALWSFFIAINESASMALPNAWVLVRGLAAAWLILAVWGGFGLLLGVATRGTSMAIGCGLLYGLVIEGLLSAIADSVSWLQPLLNVFLRANGYSLIRPLGLDIGAVRDSGPGSYSGPYVDWLRALVVLAVYIVGFLLVTGLLVKKRDVD